MSSSDEEIQSEVSETGHPSSIGSGIQGASAVYSSVSFSVLSAVQGPFFTAMGTEADIQNQVAATGSFKAICQNCPTENVRERIREIKVNARATSNLIRHLQTHHEEKLLIDFKNFLQRQRQAFALENPNQRNRTRLSRDRESLQKEFDHLVVKFILSSMCPLRVVDNPDFIHLVNFQVRREERLAIMSRRKLGRCIDDAFMHHQTALRDVLTRPLWVATTTDIWSATTRSFIGMTVHWIDTDFARRSAVLACKRFAGEHTYDKIAPLVDEIHKSFNLSESRIVSTTTDNGSNSIEAFKEFHVADDNICIADFEEDEVTDDGEQIFPSEPLETASADFSVVVDVPADRLQLPKHLRCAAHTLALCLSRDFDTLLKGNKTFGKLHSDAMIKCNAIWSLTRRPKTAEIIKNVLGRALPRPVPSRWNSLYDSFVGKIHFPVRYPKHI